MGFRFARWIIILICRLSIQLEIDGLENLPEGPVIVVSNHLGRLDPALLYYILNRRDVILMAAEKYKKYAIFRWFARRLNAIWVDRYNADLGAMRQALTRLKEGYCLAVAPEGTRSKTEALLEARSGVGYLAAKSGYPILPVGIQGTEDRLVKQQLTHLRKAKVHVQIGKSFSLPPLDSKNREEALREYTEEIMCQIAALLPSKYHGFYNDHPRLKQLLESQHD